MKLVTKKIWALTTAAICLSSSVTVAAEKEMKNPVTQYWMNVATQSTTIPGMSSEEMSGFGGMIMGNIAGIGPKRSLILQLNSPTLPPSDPEATHDIPPGQKMGKTLPLLIPEHEKSARSDEPEGKVERPKARMLIYWGCGETVRPGQPKVLDTEKMSVAEFAKAVSGRTGSLQHPPSLRSGWAYAEWPNKKNSQEVPKGSSLQGDHFIHGNYTPDIAFSVGEKHDFMAPVEFTTVTGGLADSIKFQWKKIPTAIGYFAMAIGHNEKTGETIVWSTSEVQEPGYGLLSYLSPADVSRFIKEKVVMGPDTSSCAIPKGLFKDTGGSALQFIGYGDELNLAHPPKPKDPKLPHHYIWIMKLRNKSTGMLPLGQEERREERRTKERQQGQDEQPADAEKREESPEKKKGTLDKMRGIFGF